MGSFGSFIPASASALNVRWQYLPPTSRAHSECGSQKLMESLSPQPSVQKFISEDRLPHLLLYGPPGTGKTSTILACAKQLYKDKEFGSMVLEVNGVVLS